MARVIESAVDVGPLGRGGVELQGVSSLTSTAVVGGASRMGRPDRSFEYYDGPGRPVAVLSAWRIGPVSAVTTRPRPASQADLRTSQPGTAEVRFPATRPSARIEHLCDTRCYVGHRAGRDGRTGCGRRGAGCGGAAAAGRGAVGGRRPARGGATVSDWTDMLRGAVIGYRETGDEQHLRMLREQAMPAVATALLLERITGGDAKHVAVVEEFLAGLRG